MVTPAVRDVGLHSPSASAQPVSVERRPAPPAPSTTTRSTERAKGGREAISRILSRRAGNFSVHQPPGGRVRASSRKARPHHGGLHGLVVIVVVTVRARN